MIPTARFFTADTTISTISTTRLATNGAICIGGTPAAVIADPLPAVMTREPDPPSKLEQKAAPVAVNLLPEDNGSVRVRVRRLAWNLTQNFKALPGEGRFQTLAHPAGRTA